MFMKKPRRKLLLRKLRKKQLLLLKRRMRKKLVLLLQKKLWRMLLLKGRPKKVAEDKAKPEAQAKEETFVKIEKEDQKLLRLENARSHPQTKQ